MLVTWIIPRIPYLCTVFFIVFRFKVNKGWSTAVLLFLYPYFRKSPLQSNLKL